MKSVGPSRQQRRVHTTGAAMWGLERTGRELTEDNVWIAARRRELHSLQAILNRLAAEKNAHHEAIAGAGTAGRIPSNLWPPAAPTTQPCAKPTPTSRRDRQPTIAGSTASRRPATHPG